MKCDEAAERITALLDGELSPEERRDLESHLASCAACREAREAEEAVVARLRALPRPPLPSGFSASVMGKVRAGEGPADARPAGRILPMWPAWAAAGAVAAAILAMVMVGPGRGKGARDVANANPPAAKGPPPPSTPVPVMAPAPGVMEAREGVDTPAAETDDKEGSLLARTERLAEEDRAAAPMKPEAPAGSKDFEGERAGDEGKSRAKSAGEDTTAVTAPMEPGGAGGAAAGPAPSPPRAALAPAAPAAEAPEAKSSAKSDAGAKAKVMADTTRKTVEPPLPRVPLFFRVDGIRAGQDSVERVLFAERGLVLARNPWRPAAELPTTYYGRLRRDIEKEAASRKSVDAPLPEDRVLEIRMRSEDVPRFQALLAKSGTLRIGPDLQIQGSGEVVPAEIVAAAKKLQAVMDNSGLLGEDGGGAEPDSVTAHRDAAPPKDPKPDEGLGALGGREPGQPRDPPALTADALRELEKGPRPPSPSGQAAAAAGGSSEVWVEVHLLLVPPVARPPK